MSGVRARFVRDVIELVEREHGRDAIRSGVAKLSARIGTLGDFVAVRTPPAGEGLPASEAEELLLGLDAVLGDGSGRLLEAASTEVFARVLGPGGLTVRGDLMSSAARLRAPLEHVFVEQHIVFDVAASSSGFSVFLGVPGRPRAARLLRHVAVGALRAAQRFAREGMNEDVRIAAETVGDRVRLDVKLEERTQESPAPPIAKPSEPPPGARRSSKPHLMSTQPTLDAVERIIARASITPVQPSEPPGYRTDAPLPRRSTPPPRLPSEPPPPTRPTTDPWPMGRAKTAASPVERPRTNPESMAGGGAARKSSGLYRMTNESEEKINEAPPSKKVP
jgi:hypothetical protein